MSEGHRDMQSAAPDEPAALAVGQILRAAREARGESLSDAAYALKLTQRQVEAIEHERFELLPGPAFVRGFVRNYARHLELDAEALISGLRPEWMGQPTVKLAPLTNAAGAMPDGGGARKAVRPAAGLVVGMLVVLGLGWYFDWFTIADKDVVAIEQPMLLEPPRERAETGPGEVAQGTADPIAASAPADNASVEARVEPPPAAATDAGGVPDQVGAAEVAAAPEGAADAPVAAGAAGEPGSPPDAAEAVSPGATAVEESGPAPAQPSGAVEAPPGAAADAVAGDQLVFRLQGESWIQVRDADGAVLYVGIGRAGTTRTVQGRPPFAIVVGNAGDVTLEYRGEPVDLTPHTRTGVARVTVP